MCVKTKKKTKQQPSWLYVYTLQNFSNIFQINKILKFSNFNFNEHVHVSMSIKNNILYESFAYITVRLVIRTNRVITNLMVHTYVIGVREF